MSDVLQFITDRTQTDVDRAVFLNALKWAGMDSIEQEEYLAGLKGAYTFSDLNRVENAVQVIADMLGELGFTVTVNTRSWAVEDIPSESALSHYLPNIRTLMNSYHIRPTTPELPESMDYLDYETANDIERILMDIYTLMQGEMSATRFSDTFYAGQEGLR